MSISSAASRLRPPWLPEDWVERSFEGIAINAEFLLNGRKFTKTTGAASCTCSCGHQHAVFNAKSDGLDYIISNTTKVWIAP